MCAAVGINCSGLQITAGLVSMSSMLSAVSSAPYSLGLDAWALQTNSSEKATAQDTAGSEPEETKRLRD